MFAAGTLSAEVFNSAMFSNPRQTPPLSPIWVNVMQLRRVLAYTWPRRLFFFLRTEDHGGVIQRRRCFCWQICTGVCAERQT